jgi:hypothetical protein
MNTIQQMTKATKLVLITIASISTFVSCESKSEKEKSELARIGAEPLSDITWEEIDKIYNPKSTFTELQKDEHWKNYKGKKVRWSGKVSSVGETFGTLQLQVKLNPDTFTSDVLIRLHNSSRSDALKLQEDNSVTFEGILDDWGTLMPITLDHGIIINNSGEQDAALKEQPLPAVLFR